jgi:hypothetical protein
MWPHNGSATRLLPSLLPGSSGKNSPAFRRYYEAATTTGLVWRHSVCHVAPPYLRLISSLRSPSRGNRRADTRVLWNRSHPLLPVFCPKDAFGSPKFPVNPSCIGPALRLRSGLHARLMTAFRYGPRTARRRRPQRFSTFEAQSHGFCTGCLRFVPPSRTTTQNSLPVVSQTFPDGLFHAH